MRMRGLRGLGLWLPPVLLMGLIFFLSAQPSLDSGLGLVDLIGRKLIHFTAYALLCFLWWRALTTVTSQRPAVVAALVVASAYAITDEYHQSLVEGRSGNPLDWGIDTAGAALVALRLWATAGRRTTA
jgi:VanZ family protein